ncbi:hypothetical protein [Halobacillus aidingensis]|uniref:Uncharacterized protein n=1 Tax=Halobacillus aidingensis TaxID=240303 RepID=A0A1H0GJR6_HALAD|nr:hypothetical protein [Halobacillus aidingensis]SDO07094.1 hypothetical protein SAMN05421677_102346 [Halobacillus aidingensis]
MELMQVYPWLMPALLIISIGTLLGSYLTFRAEKYMMLIAIGMVQTLISTMLATSVGPLLFGIGLTQFYVGIVNMKKVKGYET